MADATAQPTATADPKDAPGSAAPDAAPGAAAAAPISQADLALIPTELADAGKTPAEMWDEIEAEEKGLGAANTETPDPNAPPPGAEDDPEDDDPEDKPAATDGEDAAPARTEPPTGEPDRWAAAPPELKAEFDALKAEQERLQQTVRSHAGRESALQKKVNELARRQPSATPATGASGGQPQQDVFKTDVWKNFETEYPELAAPLKTVVSSLNLKVGEQQQVLDAITEDRERAAVDEQIALLTKEHADWRSHAASPEFGPWLEAQPRHIREAAARNSPAIVDAREAADVVGRFKDFRSAKQAPGNGAEPRTPGNGGQSPTARQEPPNGQSRTGTGTALATRRQRQLDSSAGTRSKGPGVANGIPEDGDPKQIWAMIDEQEKREGARA